MMQPELMPAIGLFGGTFDPIHNGHLQLALSVYTHLQLRQIRFIPCAQPLLRTPPVATATQRLAMVNIAIKPYAYFMADDCEIKRGGLSYTIDTLRELRATMPDTPLCFMLSADQFLQFDQWRDWQDIPTLAHLIITTRPGYHFSANPRVQAFIQQHQVDDIKRLHQTSAGAVFFHQLPSLPVSGTQIRLRLQQGESVQEMVPEEVLRYIWEQRIYIMR